MTLRRNLAVRPLLRCGFSETRLAAESGSQSLAIVRRTIEACSPIWAEPLRGQVTSDRCCQGVAAGLRISESGLSNRMRTATSRTQRSLRAEVGVGSQAAEPTARQVSSRSVIVTTGVPLSRRKYQMHANRGASVAPCPGASSCSGVTPGLTPATTSKPGQ